MRLIKQTFGALFLLSFIVLLYYNSNTFYPVPLYPDRSLHNNSFCIFPNLEPWSEEVKPWVQIPQPLNCTKRFPRLFNSNLTDIIPVEANVFKNNKISSCCYRGIIRPIGQDYKFKLTLTCTPLSLEKETRIPADPECEFIAVQCIKGKKNRSVIVDMHAFPLGSLARAEKRKNNTKRLILKEEKGEKLNVLIFGFDSQSRMNFIRMMPKSYKFLMEKLSAIEMKGFNRVGAFTHENEPPMFSSKNPNELEKDCLQITRRLDNCPFIWKKYSRSGYLTGLGEDTQSTFHIEYRGYLDPPVDFYMRPFMLAAQRNIASEKRLVYHLCSGPRLWYQVVLDYVKKVSQAMESSNAPLFFNSWVNGLAHDDAGYLSFADKPLLSILEYFANSNYLNKTVLVLVGDHGMEYGEIRNTRSGNSEANLPLLIYALPPLFKKKYPMSYKNLMKNSNRLTTAFDFYATLENLLYLEKSSKIELKKFFTKNSQTNSSASLAPSRGISLFQSIPHNRTCDDAGIDKYYCSCVRRTMNVSVNDIQVKKVAKFIVNDINSRIEKDWMKCAKLFLRKIHAAHKRYSMDGTAEDGLIVTVETTPGRGIFEGVVKTVGKEMFFERDTYRINPYKNQSDCVGSRGAKMFCFCTKRNRFF